MIGKLKGIVDSVQADYAIIDVSGVGYLAFCSAKTLANLVPGEPTELLIETHVREDHIHLYGFRKLQEKSTFLTLQSVKGVGTKMALNILSTLLPEDIELALSAQDKDAFTQVSGVGKKLAERIITELKDKFTNRLGISPMPISSNSKMSSSIANDAISALVSLGINKSEAYNRINVILAHNTNASINDLIKLALKKEI